MQRVMAYVDGFNLYFGLKQSSLKRCANGYLNIGEDKLRASQLPEQLVKPDGYVLARPATWR